MWSAPTGPATRLELILEGTAARHRFLDQTSARIERRATMREEIDVVDSVRVLSPRHTEPLLDTPQTITIVDADLIQAQGATSLRDVLRNVTGISIQAGEGGGGLPGDNLAIRGFAARNDIFVDGVRDFGSYSRDPYNIQQVEVSKGPASVFAGRGSTGGAINLVTKQPTLMRGLDADISGGTDDFQRTTVDYNRPLGTGDRNGAAFRLNLMYTAGRHPGPRLGGQRALRRRPVARLRPRQQDAVPAQRLVPVRGQHARVRHSLGAADQRAAGGVRRPAGAGRLRQLLRPRGPRLRGHLTTLATASVEHDLAPWATLRG